MNRTDLVWAVGRVTLGTATRSLAPLRVYGADRVPRAGGTVLAFNHFSWLDPPVFGAASPRNFFFLAKAELHDVPVVGPLIRSFGTYAVRRGESDREAVRQMRRCVHDGNALGVFAEGTRQRRGVPGEVKPGAAMVALQERSPVVCAAIHGTQLWKLGNFQPVSVAWGRPVSFDDLPANGKGYREASAEIERRIHALWRFLVDMHALGRPRHAAPPE
ncbi:MAG: 1-acyl-sn-glycerol-3-phosphate acyltransferase [Actinobacteria bacterium]|nr:1-acyl-sn-glycerol-3-phosphate acyltransferase [Actinomycetota bacterium]